MYGDFTNMVDANVGKVLAALKRNSMYDGTMVVFTSDNGPVWYESDVEKYGHDSSGGLRGMKADAWECGHRMPFLVRWPGTVTAASVSNKTICFTDFLATFSQLVGKAVPQDQGPDSFSFLSELMGKGKGKRSEQNSEKAWPTRKHLVIASGKKFTIREGKWKFIEGLGSGGFTKPSRIRPKKGEPTDQLYDLESDLGETNNLFDEHPEIVARLKEALKEIVESGASR